MRLPRLFGRKPARPGPEPLRQAILAFLQARTWSESRRVVEEHPELLSDEADALLGQLIAAQEDASARRDLEERRALLRRCREVGIESAFREKIESAFREKLEDLLGALEEALEEHPELRALLEQVQERMAQDLVMRGIQALMMEALSSLLSAAPSEEEMRRHPLYQLAERVMQGELSLEAALRQATAPDTLKALDDRAIDRLDDYIIALSRDPARPIQARVRAYILAELNHAAAQALPASPAVRAYTANTLGNCIEDYPFKTPAHRERRVESYREALTIWQQEGDERRAAMLQNNLGNAYSNLAAVRDREANLERAIAAYREALGMIDRFLVAASVAAQLGLQEEWAGLYARAVEACHRAGQPALAFAIAEGSKSRLLTGLLGRGDLPAPDVLTAELVAQERALADRLNALDAAALARHGRATTAEEGVARLAHLQQRQALVDQLRAVWQKMEGYGPQASDYVALRRGDRPSWEGLARLAEALGPQTALLSLFTTGERILLFVLRAGWERPQSVEVSLAPNELRYVYLANYADEVLNRRRHLQAGRPLTHRWRGLGQPLLSPVLPYLEGVTHLVIAPESLFHMLPLHALELNGEGETLLDRYALSYIPALGLLERLWRRRPIVQGEAVVVGYTPADPTTQQGQVERQLFLGEARAVAKQMGVEALLDQEATAERLREVLSERTLRLVHLSCHGSFDPEDPLRSGVLLADGLFTARQWMELRFRADLVTLSACETGRSGRLAGDELAGLSQALLYAGASS
ncbi:CHAT domain-containing protein, partial [Thermoflexus hugenholtzii]